MGILLILFFIVFIGAIAKGIITYIDNENSPIISTKANLVKKKRNTHTHTDANGITSIDETFILIFQLDTGSEMRFTVKRRVFRSIAENQWGSLTFQGTRFIKFQWEGGIVER
ncbi:DUF2500 domain-containing protein [Clostridium sp. YIM B02505]|uniref:DUF2500 domain-containing protein n=1 Tax=Clostridium yunnanense TaxID=2800325 RepID=A0ABS1EIE2_9CLOT|nr:DUF2500 domain-containing protein [Clostridium yunnanense]MBK1809115.1 DUF2500 domain-containing protein [Clostridium yunnanense]